MNCPNKETQEYNDLLWCIISSKNSDGPGQSWHFAITLNTTVHMAVNEKKTEFK